MRRSRSPLTLRCDGREQGRERSFSMSSLSSCSIGNDYNRSRRGGCKGEKHKQHPRNENKFHEHDRKHRGGYHSGNDRDRFRHSSRDKPKSRNEHRDVYLNFDLNTHDSNNEELVDPSVCNFPNTSHTSDGAERRNPNSDRLDRRSVERKRSPNGDRLERLERMVEVLVQNKQKSNLSGPMEPVGSADSLNPKNNSLTTSVWLNKISEQCMDQNFDDTSCIRYMESKMDGIMKAWYKTLDTHDFTWPELKILITRTFPDNIDFAATLHLLVDRVKKSDESITQYYFSKMYLLEACKITGTNAVSCLIDGLNDGYIQEEAKASNYLTPESLYSYFLTKLNNNYHFLTKMHNNDGLDVGEIESHSQEKVEFDDELSMNHFQRKSKPLEKKKCFTCGKLGHIAEKCRHAPLCYNCGHKGHIAAKCLQRIFTYGNEDTVLRNYQ